MDGATLFSVGDLFPRTECLDSLMGFDKDNDYGAGYSQVIKNDGKIQKLLAEILNSMGESVYVDARRQENSLSYMFEYSSNSSDGLPVHHFSADNTGDCLTFEAPAGTLVTRGIDCSSKKKPLCLRVDEASADDVTNLCETCSAEGNWILDL